MKAWLRLLFLASFCFILQSRAFAEDIEKDCGDHIAVGDKCKAKIHDLHPTQGAVGKEEVRRKSEHLKKSSDDDQKDFRKQKLVPVVLGPDNKLYMIDHHHTVLSFLDLGYDTAYIQVVGDFSDAKSIDEFWDRMIKKNWCYPFDGKGNPIKPTDIPSDVKKLDDDPYRSVSGIARDWGAYEKSDKPFQEFIEARNYEKLDLLKGTRPEDYDAAAHQAVALSKWGFWSHPAQCEDRLKQFLKELPGS